MNAVNIAVNRLFRELLCVLPVAEMGFACNIKVFGFFQQFFPDLLVVADININYRFPAAHIRHQVLDYRAEQLSLCACSADSKQEPHRLVLALSHEAFSAVVLEVCDKLVVDIVSRIDQAVCGHRLKDFLFSHAVEYSVAHICLMRLNGMNASLGKVQCHRPVIGDSVDNILHSGVDSRLSRPDMSSDYRQIFRDIFENRRHQLGVFLV